jgi:hypothetical protein
MTGEAGGEFFYSRIPVRAAPASFSRVEALPPQPRGAPGLFDAGQRRQTARTKTF